MPYTYANANCVAYQVTPGWDTGCYATNATNVTTTGNCNYIYNTQYYNTPTVVQQYQTVAGNYTTAGNIFYGGAGNLWYGSQVYPVTYTPCPETAQERQEREAREVEWKAKQNAATK